MRWLSIAAALAGALLIPTTAPAQERPVDLELVLAVDASGSVSDEEFNLQVHGLAEAFRHRSVGQAIRAAGDLGLAVALIQWADDDQHALSVDWTVVRDTTSAHQFAKQVEGVTRSVYGNTALGVALEFAILQLEGNGFVGRRKVIDVSGDGPSNQGSAAWLVRDLAVARGITVNCVAPGHIDTVRGASAGQRSAQTPRPIERMGRADEIAAMVRHLCLPGGAYITGQTIHVNGGMYLA